MNTNDHYDIGTPGQAWGAEEKGQWLIRQVIQRSYKDLVLEKIRSIAVGQPEIDLVVDRYGALSYDDARYPLYAFRSATFSEEKPCILITGGVHGYETSGVMGALRFVETEFANYKGQFDFVVAPCVSPWAFETINRWNPHAVDPNRSFYLDSTIEESSTIMRYVDSMNLSLLAHIDLHETTDTDNSEFRPALSARDAIVQKTWNIPDGFYAVGDTSRPEPSFQKAIVDAVEQVTHIAPADQNGELIGDKLQQKGVINYAKRELGLCAGFTEAAYVSTTEVYPDSDLVDEENCIAAQVAAICGALDFLKRN